LSLRFLFLFFYHIVFFFLFLLDFFNIWIRFVNIPDFECIKDVFPPLGTDLEVKRHLLVLFCHNAFVDIALEKVFNFTRTHVVSFASAALEDA